MDCNELAKLSRRRVYVRDEFLAMQGQPFDTLVAIESGSVKLTRVNLNGLEVILALRGVGEIVHLPSGVPLRAHSASVQALTGCIALTWTSEKLVRAMVRLPRLCENISGILASHLHDLEERYHDLAVEKVEVRLAKLLIDLAQRFGGGGVGGYRLTLSRTELAQMTGTTLFTVSRLIAYWGGLGLVVPSRGAVLVLKPALLATLVAYKEPLLTHIEPLVAHVVPLSTIAEVLLAECKPNFRAETFLLPTAAA